jgi:hypothetical protein
MVKAVDDEQLVDLLKRALAAVENSGAPDDLREAAFTATIRMLSGGTAEVPQPELRTDGGTSGSTGATRRATTSELLDKIAQGLEIDGTKVAKVFADKDGQPELIVKTSMLPATKSGAASEIALLVMAARQAAGIDDYTEAEAIRAACKRYGKFDSANFGSSMKSLDNFILTSGKGVSTKRKLTNPGLEAAVEMIEKYASDS